MEKRLRLKLRRQSPPRVCATPAAAKGEARKETPAKPTRGTYIETVPECDAVDFEFDDATSTKPS
jgi:hypothetical protein